MFKIFKIEGDSMYPLLKDTQKIFCIKAKFINLKQDDIVVFHHPQEGLMIKYIKSISSDGYYVKGTSAFSIDSSIFGHLKKEDILYKMLFKF